MVEYKWTPLCGGGRGGDGDGGETGDSGREGWSVGISVG